MGVVKRIVCLANSRKLSGHCVAGKEWTAQGRGAWVRPVSARPNEEVSEYERCYQGGAEPSVLELIDLPLLEPRPRAYQPENWLLDPHAYWVRAGQARPQQLAALVDRPRLLWLNASSSASGLHDRVALSDAERLGYSLLLLQLDNLRLRAITQEQQHGPPRRRLQACFWYAEAPYRLWVTDPLIEQEYLAGGDGEFRLGRCWATVSLGEPFQGFCYKLVAAVIRPGREG